MHIACLGHNVHCPLEIVSGIGRKQRRKLCVCVCVFVARAESHARQASALVEAPWEQLCGSQHVLWMGNFYRRRFRPLLGSDDVSANCTVAMAMVPAVKPSLQCIIGSLPKTFAVSPAMPPHCQSRDHGLRGFQGKDHAAQFTVQCISGFLRP